VTAPVLVLKPGRERSVCQGHPWIFSGAVDRLEGSPGAGDTVEIVDHHGNWLARAGYSPQSQISARVWTWESNQRVDGSFLRSRITRAYHSRDPLLEDTNAVRRIYAENDGVPGLIVDQYGSVLVVQCLTAAIEKWKPDLIEILSSLPEITCVYERSDADARAKEGLDIKCGLLWGKEPPDRILIRERSWTFRVDIRSGHKTGFYLDQRDSREMLSQIVARYVRGGEALNCFSYTGAFAVVAAESGKLTVVNVDSSVAALSEINEHFKINHLPPENAVTQCGNVFEVLREFRDSSRMFDLVILDPPKLVQARKDLERAARGYKDLNWLAARILRPGGVLMTFSCSGLLGDDLFQKIVFSAILDAGRDAQILQRCHQPADHPIRLAFPEGRYLTGLVCRMI
jgi:23S rRNA (cytosine1962-C5)-methyltransferase